MPSPRIGVDESGKGDYFGPLVVAACYVDDAISERLGGVMDSKKLTDAAALRLADIIAEHCPHHVIVWNPAEYNAKYEAIRNLNHLLADGHAAVIDAVMAEAAAELIISDEFARGGAIVKKRLGPQARAAQFVSRVRAEADLAVAAASVLARAGFLRALAELSETYGTTLPKGATVVRPVGEALVRKHGRDVLRQVAKLHFRTTEQILAATR
ncbi:MAG: ribonuclease HIII [Fimbriimonadaceae bacterium]|nr:ribonuclease HIII [Fimbriimonadaceae bacterium]